MVKRKQIALIFSYNENWIGGTYYILNLVHALKLLPENDLPNITICSKKHSDFEKVRAETSYPYLDFFDATTINLRLTLFQRSVNFISYRLFKTVKFQKKIPQRLPDNFDLIFPNPMDEEYSETSITKHIYWVADFQEAHLPNFFSKHEIYFRKKTQLYIALLADKSVFSSNDALNDFKTLYPFYTCQPKLLRFAVTHPNYSHLDINQLREKYNLPKSYFMSPNQFWVHKNHQVILNALLKFKKEGKNVAVIFTGKEYDHRQPEYTDKLKNFVREHELEQYAYFLGFIDRKEQLQLMHHSMAIIQPSFFEGWSTVVEDAKAMKKLVVASWLNVHKEQLGEHGIFFNPDDSEELKTHLTKIINGTIPVQINYPDYQQNKLTFASNFMALASS